MSESKLVNAGLLSLRFFEIWSAVERRESRHNRRKLPTAYHTITLGSDHWPQKAVTYGVPREQLPQERPFVSAGATLAPDMERLQEEAATARPTAQLSRG